MKVVLKSTSFSDKDWGSVNKSKLPKSCFLQVDGPEKGDWHFPYREGAGSIGEDGMYSSAGPVNKGALQAIWGSMQGARNAPSFSIKSSTRAKLMRLYKQAFGHEPGKPKESSND